MKPSRGIAVMTHKPVRYLSLLLVISVIVGGVSDVQAQEKPTREETISYLQGWLKYDFMPDSSKALKTLVKNMAGCEGRFRYHRENKGFSAREALFACLRFRCHFIYASEDISATGRDSIWNKYHAVNMKEVFLDSISDSGGDRDEIEFGAETCQFADPWVSSHTLRRYTWKIREHKLTCDPIEFTTYRTSRYGEERVKMTSLAKAFKHLAKQCGAKNRPKAPEQPNFDFVE